MNNTRIFPITTKIVIIFALFILVSNLTSNYINLIFNRSELIILMKQILIKDLKELYTFCNNQHEIYQFNQDYQGSIKNIIERAKLELKNQKSLALGIKKDGQLFFYSSKNGELGLDQNSPFPDKEALKWMLSNQSQDKNEDFITFFVNGSEYFGIYKYNPKWEAFLLRAEEINEFYANSRAIFRNISLIIIAITLLCAFIGIYLLRHILRFVQIITDAIMRMNQTQQLELINLKGAPNDDITFLGIAFNSLSNTINNLLNIFRKFANKDVAIRIYKEKEVRLEGSQKELTCLFSDIKSFTYMTETLGTDIINLLNLHYDRAIREIMNDEGIIGSIIGDALLAVYGVFEETKHKKSYYAVHSAYQIQSVAQNLRLKMHQIKEQILKERGALTEQEERVYKAVLIEVGVGIDGGVVFYGNIGSYERMTNTVIGDNVNSASRLEGLTRVYKVPVICSEYVKEDIQKTEYANQYLFLELDTVKVKGKTVGKKVYWPIPKEFLNPKMEEDIDAFQKGLQLYYQGDWEKARQYFYRCELPLAEVFRQRTTTILPKEWNGIWEMTEK